MSVLKAEEVTYTYKPGTRSVLDKVSLQVESGERVCLSAPSGFGKTTLCRVLAGYLQPRSGMVLVDGEPLPRKGTCPVQMIWQHPEQALDPRLRIRASLLEAGPIDEDALSVLGVRPEWLSRYPRELSGGEMQRCCIARALQSAPKFLIADEISTMLDAITQVQIWEVLLSYCEEHEVGLVMTSHSSALVSHIATRVVDLTAQAKR